uniref:Uncharacterized protein n=1 Tax=Anopheles atroparvus TaxID=41427 RepID=A0A182J4G0_ANOAO
MPGIWRAAPLATASSAGSYALAIPRKRGPKRSSLGPSSGQFPAKPIRFTWSRMSMMSPTRNRLLMAPAAFVAIRCVQPTSRITRTGIEHCKGVKRVSLVVVEAALHADDRNAAQPPEHQPSAVAGHGRDGEVRYRVVVEAVHLGQLVGQAAQPGPADDATPGSDARALQQINVSYQSIKSIIRSKSHSSTSAPTVSLSAAGPAIASNTHPGSVASLEVASVTAVVVLMAGTSTVAMISSIVPSIAPMSTTDEGRCDSASAVPLTTSSSSTVGDDGVGTASESVGEVETDAVVEGGNETDEKGETAADER